MEKYFIHIEYTFFDIETKKYGRTVYQEKIYDSKDKAIKFKNKVIHDVTEKFAEYNGEPRRIKIKLKKINV